MLRYKFFWFILFIFTLLLTFNTVAFIPLVIFFLINLISFKQMWGVDFNLVDKPLFGIVYLFTNFFALIILASFAYYNQVLDIAVLLSHLLIIIISCGLLANEYLNLAYRKIIDVIAGITWLLILIYLTVSFNWQLGLLSLVLSLIYLASLKPLIDYLLSYKKE